MVRRLHATALAAWVGCTAATTDPLRFEFLADPGAAGEAYQCFGFDAAALDGADIGGIELDAHVGSVSLHHVSLFAMPTPFADGPVACESMPDTAIPLHVWATGGGPLSLPPDLQLAVPAGTVRFVVQTHAVRTGDGAPPTRALTITPRRGASHRAGWLPLRAPTPALRPHHVEEATATCRIAGELHLISTWPHMHQVGKQFRGAVMRDGDGAVESFVTVDPWSFDAQRAYAIDTVVAPNQTIETHCTWQNDSDHTILPGPSIHDEMCGQSLMAWPVEAARCE
ncbi:MAG: hypothetical protein KF773_16955 [Deltaproteobacteria bacterium]|nr:hypothetical protein [Deltaproteobacteria bacterium]